MEKALREVIRAARIGKMLIAKDANNSRVLQYMKIPNEFDNRMVLLLDPILDTGATAELAIRSLLEQGATADQIVFLNVRSSEVGIRHLMEHFPQIRIVTTWIESDHESSNQESLDFSGKRDFGYLYFGA